MSDGANIFMTWLIVTAHTIFALAWLYYFVKETKETIRKTFPKVYLILFACRNQSRLTNEAKADDYRSTRLSPFVTTCEEAIDYLQSRVKMYQQGLIPKEDQALRIVMNPLTNLINNLNEMRKDEIVKPSVSVVEYLIA